MQNLTEIDNLIKLISKLPGLGPKSAKRIILKMINNRKEILKPLANNLNDVFKNIERCRVCGTLKSNNNHCHNCEDKSKKYSKICVVENISDQWAIESSSIFQGYFHILGGTISDSNNSNNREDLLINSLIERVKNDNIDEVIDRVVNTQGEFVLYAMTAQSFESLALNFEQIKRFIEAQNQVILYYEKSVIIEQDLD